MNAMVGHVRRAQAQERSYIEALTNGQEAERARLARELHDDTVQSLIAIAQSLEIAQGFLEVDAPAAGILKATRGQAVQTVDNLRRLIASLRPPILAELGLVPALQVLAEGTTPTEISIKGSGSLRRLDEIKELVLFRVAQEAVWNSIRHGQAQEIIIHVMFHADHIHMLIRDNGTGFEPPKTFDILFTTGHYGLVGINERIQMLDGSFQISSQIGKGTQIEISVPVEQNAQPSDVVRDPVCSAVIQPQQAYSRLEYQGQHFYFCCPVCVGAFQSNPAVYLRGRGV